MPSASSRPRSPREVADWLDAAEAELTWQLAVALTDIERGAKSGIPGSWDVFLSETLTPFLADLYFDAAVIAADEDEPEESWAGHVRDSSPQYVNAAVARFRQVGQELWTFANRQSLVAAAKDSIASQAGVVALNETAAAFANGARAGIDALPSDNRPTMHTWMTMRDMRVRDTHRAVDGDTRPVDEPFIVGGNRMMYPHDPSAPIEETANCRCVVLYLRG